MGTKVKILASMLIVAACLTGCGSTSTTTNTESNVTKYYCGQTTLDGINIIINSDGTDIDSLDYEEYMSSSVYYSLKNDMVTHCEATYTYQCGDVVYVQALDTINETNYMYKFQIDTETGLITNYVRYELAA